MYYDINFFHSCFHKDSPYLFASLCMFSIACILHVSRVLVITLQNVAVSQILFALFCMFFHCMYSTLCFQSTSYNSPERCYFAQHSFRIVLYVFPSYVFYIVSRVLVITFQNVAVSHNI